MKKTFFSGILFVFSLSVFSQIFTPSGIVGTSNDADKTLIGTYLNPSNYGSRLMINTKINNNNSTHHNLELNCSFQTPQVAPGTPYSPPTISIIKANRWDSQVFPSGSWSTVFDLKADGKLWMGTTEGDGTLNMEGVLNLFYGTTRQTRLTPGVLAWRSGLPAGNAFENFDIRYLGDGTNPAFDIMRFRPNGTVNIYGNSTFSGKINPANTDYLAIGNVAPQAKVHIKANSTNSGTNGQVNGLLIENNGDRNHDYALQITTAHGKLFTVSNAGTVHIGSGLNFTIPSANYKLYVEDGIRTERIRVDVAADNGWADYVFEEGYELMSLEEVETFIKENGHLPGIPSAEEVTKEGIDLAEMNKLLLEKIEELTLQIIAVNKELKSLKSQIPKE